MDPTSPVCFPLDKFFPLWIPLAGRADARHGDPMTTIRKELPRSGHGLAGAFTPEGTRIRERHQNTPAHIPLRGTQGSLAEDVVLAAKDAALRPNMRVREADAMEVNFGITLRGPAEPIPDQDARRVSGMRRLARARLNHCGLASMTDPVTLVVSELVTNAIMHSGGTQVSFRMQLRDGLLYLAVGSDTPGKPAVREPNTEAEHGRGLQLVEFVVLGSGGVWGISDDGAAVWCLFPAKGEDR